MKKTHQDLLQRHERWAEAVACSICGDNGKCPQCVRTSDAAGLRLAEQYGVRCSEFEGHILRGRIQAIYFAPDVEKFVLALRPLAYAFVEPRNIHLFADEHGRLDHLIGKWKSFVLASDMHIWGSYDVRPTLLERLLAATEPWTNP